MCLILFAIDTLLTVLAIVHRQFHPGGRDLSQIDHQVKELMQQPKPWPVLSVALMPKSVSMTVNILIS